MSTTTTQIIVRFPKCRTISIISSWVAMGLYSELTGPTLPYLKYRVDGNYEEMGRTLAARSIGYLLGALLGGILCGKWLKYGDHILSVSLVLGGAVTCGAPYTAHWMTLSICFFLDGLAKGIIAVSASMLILHIWGEKATVPNTALHFAFGIGALCSQQVVRPFLNEPEQDAMDALAYNSNGTATPAQNTALEYVQSDTTESSINYLEAPIEYPYIIVGVINFVTSLVLWLFHFLDKPKIKHITDDQCEDTHMTCMQKFHPNAWFGEMGSNCNSVVLPTVYVIIGLISIGTERAYGKFLFSFAVESSLDFSPKKAAILDSVFWASFTAGRGLATVAAICLRPVIVINFCAVINLTTIVILAIFGSVHPLVTWIGSGVYGATNSPLYSVAMSWMNRDVGFSSTAASISFISTAVGAFLFSWMAGYLFQYHGPNSLMYMLSVTSTVCLIAVVIMAVSIGKVVKYKGTKLQDINERNGEKEVPCSKFN